MMRSEIDRLIPECQAMQDGYLKAAPKFKAEMARWLGDPVPELGELKGAPSDEQCLDFPERELEAMRRAWQAQGQASLDAQLAADKARAEGTP